MADTIRIPQQGKLILPNLCYYCSVLANECPDDKYLNRHVVSELAAACAYHPDVWHALGIELLGQGEIAGLDVIKANNSHDVKNCCSAMLTLWRQRQIDASWGQLIGALKQLKLNRVAMEIEKRLKSTEQEDDKVTGATPQGMKIIPTQLKQTKRCSLESSKGMLSHLDFERCYLYLTHLFITVNCETVAMQLHYFGCVIT